MTSITASALTPRSVCTTETRLEASLRALIAAATRAGIDPTSYKTRSLCAGEVGHKWLDKGDEIQILVTDATRKAVKTAFHAIFDASKFAWRTAPVRNGVPIETRVDKNRVSYFFVTERVEGSQRNCGVNRPIDWVPPR